MMNYEEIMIGTAVFMTLFVLIRLFLAKRRPNTIDLELQRVLTDSQFKVKGRADSRADLSEQ